MSQRQRVDHGHSAPAPPVGAPAGAHARVLDPVLDEDSPRPPNHQRGGPGHAVTRRPAGSVIVHRVERVSVGGPSTRARSGLSTSPRVSG